MADFVIGIIGMGDMGRLYAKRLSKGGWKVHACDTEQNFGQLQSDLARYTEIKVLLDGHDVSRTSDYILYNIEASKIECVVRDYAKSTKQGAIVGGQTSCKAPEIKAFERHLPQDCEIVSLHSLHGPSTDPQGQPLAIVPHRASPESVSKVQDVLACLKSQTAVMTALQHDSITANTQVLISTIFLSVVLALKLQGGRPETLHLRKQKHGKPQIDDVYTLLFRIFAQKWHVYAGLSLLNPFSETYLDQYATSVRTITALVADGRLEELRQRVKATAAALKETRGHRQGMRPRMESPDPVAAFAAFAKVGSRGTAVLETTPTLPPSSLPLLLSVAILATGDMWVALNVDPWGHLHCATPQYRDWLSIVSDVYSGLPPAGLEATFCALLEYDHSNRYEVAAPGQHLARAVDTWLSYVRGQDFVAFGCTFEDTGRWLRRWDSGGAVAADGKRERQQDRTSRI